MGCTKGVRFETSGIHSSIMLCTSSLRNAYGLPFETCGSHSLITSSTCRVCSIRMTSSYWMTSRSSDECDLQVTWCDVIKTLCTSQNWPRTRDLSLLSHESFQVWISKYLRWDYGWKNVTKIFLKQKSGWEKYFLARFDPIWAKFPHFLKKRCGENLSAKYICRRKIRRLKLSLPWKFFVNFNRRIFNRLGNKQWHRLGPKFYRFDNSSL